jgi:hypothetical protein
MNSRKSFSLLFFAFIFINFTLSKSANAQINRDSLITRYAEFSEVLSPEKLYLHTDKSLYVAGEFIWFRGYLENSSQINTVEESKFIYVELYQDTLIVRAKIKKGEDGFAGQLPINLNLRSGRYTLRAYTTWMMNFQPEYMFYKEIAIVNPAKRGDAGISRDIVDNIDNRQISDTIRSISFFPESGRYLEEKFSVIAFKIVNTYGRGMVASGTLVNSKDSVITHFRTEHNGMGTIRFYPVKGERYYIKADNFAVNTLEFNLPAPSSEGVVLNVQRRDGKLFINTTITPSLLPRGANLMIHDGSEIYYLESISGTNGRTDQSQYHEKLIVIKEENLPDGISHILVSDDLANILCERLVFKYPKTLSTVTLNSKKRDEEYGQRERVEYTLSLKDTLGNPMQGEFSLSVTDSFLAPLDITTDNLKSYMLLSSEIKGHIENPALYFGEGIENRERAMDLLMMVQGWRYYDIPAILTAALPQGQSIYSSKRFKFQKEVTQSFSGRATSTLRNTKRATLSVLAPEINLAVSEDLTRSGFFSITDLNFPDSTNFIVSCTGKQGQKGYYLNIDEQQFPPLFKYSFQDRRGGFIDPGRSIIYNRIFNDIGGGAVVTLNAAVVQSSPKYAPKYNPSPFNQYFDRRQIRERSELDLYSGMSLLDYIVGNFPGLMYGTSGDDGRRSIVSTRSFNITGDQGVPLVYINRSPVQSTSDLDIYTVDDVENIAFLKGNEGFMFRTLWGVILVTLRHARENRGDWYFNTKLVSPLGWQKPSKFYSPDYSKEEDNNAVSYDTRTTLLWNPSVKTDKDGNAQIEFYTSDRVTRFNIVIEGYTNTGEHISYIR